MKYGVYRGLFYFFNCGVGLAVRFLFDHFWGGGMPQAAPEGVRKARKGALLSITFQITILSQSVIYNNPENRRKPPPGVLIVKNFTISQSQTLLKI